jgi:naringenin 3-dioxygenase
MAPATPFLPTEASGEKTLRPSFVRDEDERPQVAYNRFCCDVPVISLEGIDDETSGRRWEICRKIAAACEDWGLFQVVEHGIDAALMAEMSKMAREFFTLPSDEKLRFDMTGGKKGGFIVSSHLQVISFLYHSTISSHFIDIFAADSEINKQKNIFGDVRVHSFK